MVKERVANELRSALEALRKERDEIDDQISLMEGTLSKLGVSKGKAAKKKAGKKKKAGRKKAAAGKKRGTKKKATKKKASKKKATKKKATKKKATKKKKPYWSPAARAAARERMRKYWAERRKGS
jgi:hypothetical protein